MIDDSLRFFVRNIEPRALVLKGAWGIGKTFYWKEKIIPEFFINSQLRRKDRGYAYTSLFGIDSIQEVKNSLAYSYIESDPPRWPRRAYRAIKSIFRKLIKLINKSISDEVSINYGFVVTKIKANSILNNITFLSIKGSLICIDDLERRSSKLSINDIFGLVSYLVDQRKCRVLLILNYDALSEDDKNKWNVGKDKVFETELLYKPTPNQSIQVGLKGTEHEWWYRIIKNNLEHLSIDNVRIIARSQRFVRQLIDELEKQTKHMVVSDELRNKVVSTATLLSSAHASRGVGAPDIIEIINNYRSLLSHEDEKLENLSESEKQWMKVIQEYNLEPYPVIDEAIAHSVLDGYPRMDLLYPAVEAYEKDNEFRSKQKKFDLAWSLYHGTFKDNPDEIYQAFRDAIPGIIATEGAYNIESTARILRVIGHPEAATEMLTDWVKHRSGNRAKELQDDHINHWHIISDYEFLEIISNSKNDLLPLQMPLLIALEQLDSPSWDDEAIEAVAEATPDDIAEALMSIDRNWRRVSKLLPNYNLHGVIGEKAKNNFVAALKIISKISKLSADRVVNKAGELPG